MRRWRWIVLGSLVTAGTAFSGPSPELKLREETPGLLARARVKPEDARKTALGKVKGRVQAQEIEEEKGKLVYAFEIKTPHESGIEEVLIDADSGDVVSVEHEDAKTEGLENK